MNYILNYIIRDVSVVGVVLLLVVVLVAVGDVQGNLIM
jgi:hypothetical protein